MQRRQPNQSTPCHLCPKSSPEHAERLKLNDRSMATVVLFLRNRALFGRHLTQDEAMDPLLAKNFTICESVFKRFEASQNAERVGEAVSRFTLGSMNNGRS